MTKTILAADDSPSIRHLVSLTLSSMGYRVVAAENGAQALQSARTDTIDMVVTDLNMPVMDGLTFIRELRKLPSCKGVPVILLTTESDGQKKQEAKAAGATGWITKPFQQEQLVAVAKKVLGA